MNFREWGGRQRLSLHYEGLIAIRKVRINSGGYTDKGEYFGVGQPVYHVTDVSDQDDLDCHIRAADREDAKRIVLAQFPKAKIRR